ncbi:MAG TPA: PilZ domain-containing protein [Candidatus Saccharimonadales bacterium]|jgi:hypothetical protein|nr:PilZ domain-containing protein [Candidatus Saccharimonadales bacterium]
MFESAERRWSRHKIDIRLKVTAALADGTQVSVFGRGKAMSQGGIGAYIPATLSLGAPVDLELTFPYSADEVRVQAVVRSCEGFRYGLEFVEVPREIQQTIVKSCATADGAQFSV